ncbi:MAG: alpha/beta hydrolase, partial [Gemmatimonadaceae bacterium]
PAEAHVVHPVTGGRERVTLTRGTFGEVVRAMMYTPTGARALPLSVHEAYRGDYSALATAALLRQRNMLREGWVGLYLAVTCAEDIARADEAATYAKNRGTILGDFRAKQHFGACNGWPLRPDGEEWPAGQTTPPVLMIVGDQDPVTPPRWAELAMNNASRARLVVVPQGGHGFAGMSDAACLGTVQRAFVDGLVSQALDTRCVAAMRRLPFLTTR